MILLGKLIKGSPNCYSEPYMPVSELEEEMQKMQFYGYYVGKKLVGFRTPESTGTRCVFNSTPLCATNSSAKA